jgi:hypothetical protein
VELALPPLPPTPPTPATPAAQFMAARRVPAPVVSGAGEGGGKLAGPSVAGEDLAGWE